MSPKPIRRSRKAETATSLAALSAVGAPPPERSASIARPSAGKRSRSARSKVNRPSAARSGAPNPGRDSVRIGQAVRNRSAHVRRRHAGDQRSVGKGDEPMHNRLGMHDDIEPVGWQAEQVVRLDQFESLVHQTRRIDRHLRPHHPVGVGERLLAGGGGNALGAPFPERSAGSGDGHHLDRARIARADRLKQGVVLGVHRQNDRPRAPRRLHHHVAGADQRLLVGERDRAPGGDRGEGRPQSRRSDDRRNHEIGLAQRGFLDRLRTGGDFDPGSPPGRPSGRDSPRDRRRRRIRRRARSRISPGRRRRARSRPKQPRTCQARRR